MTPTQPRLLKDALVGLTWLSIAVVGRLVYVYYALTLAIPLVPAACAALRVTPERREQQPPNQRDSLRREGPIRTEFRSRLRIGREALPDFAAFAAPMAISRALKIARMSGTSSISCSRAAAMVMSAGAAT